MQPLLHNGFAVAAGNGNNRYAKLTPVISGQGLQGHLHIVDRQVTAPRRQLKGTLPVDPKIPDPCLVSLLNKMMSVFLSFQGEEERLAGVTDFTAVEYQVFYDYIFIVGRPVARKN